MIFDLSGSRKAGHFLTQPFGGVDSSWIALFGPAPAWIFPNLLVQKNLIDCIALVSFTHSHARVHRTVYCFGLKTAILRKCPRRRVPGGYVRIEIDNASLDGGKCRISAAPSSCQLLATFLL
jgi:hypothetical protein